MHLSSLGPSAILLHVSPAPLETLAVYKNRAFARFQKKARISDKDLWKAVRAVERGQIDADLGGGVIKQRIARTGEGKSGGSRSIILFRQGSRAVYVFGFEKKDRANIRPDELEAFRELAAIVLNYTQAELAKFVQQGVFTRVHAPQEEGDA